MSDEIRTLPVALSEILAADQAVEALFREGYNENAIRLGALVLRWRSLGAELTERETRGVVPSGADVEWPPRPRSVSFACNPDESAGLAEVVELRSYSRKAPCA